MKHMTKTIKDSFWRLKDVPRQREITGGKKVLFSVSSCLFFCKTLNDIANPLSSAQWKHFSKVPETRMHSA